MTRILFIHKCTDCVFYGPNIKQCGKNANKVVDKNKIPAFCPLPKKPKYLYAFGDDTE